MSSNHSNNSDRQCLSEPVPHNSSHNAQDNHHLPRLLSMTGCMLLGSASFVLSGCQSSPTVTPSATTSEVLINFENSDTALIQSQGQAFNASLNAKSERYEQLFNQAKYPNTENQAKSHLLAAIRKHLATEHVAVAQANYHMAPFIDPDSIDAGSSSLLKTIIEAYAYKKAASDDYDSDYDSDYDEYIEAEAVEEVYDNDGYDQDGYDEYGYDRYGDSIDSDDDNEVSNGVLSKMADFNPKELAKSYEAVQKAKQQKESTNDESHPSSKGMIGQVLSMIHRTPEQIAASNAYQYQNLTFHSVSRYKPKQRQLQSVYSYEYITPTISSSVQIPLAFDFNNSRIAVDPSAIMPIMALVNPEKTPLPNEMASHTVSFGLPESITTQLPPSVLYDAAIDAVQNSMAELAPEHFSAVDIRNDMFAKEVGASRAVKVYFGSKQSGEMIGKTLKYMTQSLQDHVDANPQRYPDGAMLKAALAKLQLYNKGYQSADVGALLQLIEAIAPISFNQVNYYYLDSSDRMLAKQQRTNIGSDLMGSTTTVLNQIRYDKASFNNHTLTPLLAESFGANAKPAIDGNAWMAEQRQQRDRLQAARYARYEYDDSSLSDDESSGYGDDSSNYENGEYDEAKDDTDKGK
ncbi:hypothetical protein AAIR29_04955 [Psychrobacter sp. FBL11]|uniref:Lipoprotein n=1 Tax=Psychrobacter saeujeotis TaxID=3143436 RepID=A0ABU9X6F1_9GAMM|nr:hypothetical protein [uncultured Psychrobacter sp.]